jgi:hypothetical protein
MPFFINHPRSLLNKRKTTGQRRVKENQYFHFTNLYVVLKDKVGNADLIAIDGCKQIMHAVKIVDLFFDMRHGKRSEEPHGSLGPKRRMDDIHIAQVHFVSEQR